MEVNLTSDTQTVVEHETLARNWKANEGMNRRLRVLESIGKVGEAANGFWEQSQMVLERLKQMSSGRTDYRSIVMVLLGSQDTVVLQVFTFWFSTAFFASSPILPPHSSLI